MRATPNDSKIVQRASVLFVMLVCAVNSVHMISFDNQTDSCPDHIEGLYDYLEDSDQAKSTLVTVKGSDAAWLARCIRQKLEKMRESAQEEIARELLVCIPPTSQPEQITDLVQTAFMPP